MAYDGTKPVTGSSLVSADMRENFRALKEDGIVEFSGSSGDIGDITATPSEINQACDGGILAKNNHLHVDNIWTSYSSAGMYTWNTAGWMTTELKLYAYIPNSYSDSLTFVMCCSEVGSSTYQARLQVVSSAYSSVAFPVSSNAKTWYGAYTINISALNAGWVYLYPQLYCAAVTAYGITVHGLSVYTYV